MMLNIDGLQVATELNWFKTTYGIFSLFISIILAAASQLLPEKE